MPPRLWHVPGVALFAAVGSSASSETINDPEANRVIMSMVGLLALLGVVLLVVTVWFWRSSRPDHPALGPLEVMGDAKFWRANKVEQMRRLDEVRPPGAEPERSAAQHIVASRPKVDPDEIDLELASMDSVLSFDDLVEPRHAEPVPEVVEVPEVIDVPDVVEDEPDDDVVEVAPQGATSIDPLLGPSA